ncbi:esterase/lipase family protein [Fimbriiglobus ruber]|uniref:AB hydrolase-1 domain-containing protein n=1 Tax=Fimbriiglobus ruber TaxID=1908690 RepID=A0A225DCU1_9BACT|nr:alpha/beta hydrolase [Fimbriiglobus ruber]OWK35136.1 hypothetical protein FRUB_09978 [Fimbriiglobus ruber]
MIDRGTNQGTIFLVGGINDAGFITGGWKLGLRWAGLTHRLVHFRWQHGRWALFTLHDLWNTRRHRQKAAEFADLIRACHREHPGEPIHVLAHSAGTAIASYALEALAPEESVTSAVFVGSGLSPQYDLTPVLARCRKGILAVDSPYDFVFLGIGTTLFGSCDRQFGSAAGRVGFVPAAGHEYAHLVRLPWRRELLWQGWHGGHLSQGHPRFARLTLAKWIREAEHGEQE